MITAALALFASLALSPAADVAGDGACLRWAPYARAYDIPADVYARLCHRESRGIPDAINLEDPNGGSFGLLQINAIHLRDIELHPDKWVGVNRCDVAVVEDLLHPIKNLCVASHLVRRAGGWAPWGL